MSKDQFFDDYLTGLNTGASFNGPSSLGASHRWEPPPPPAWKPPAPVAPPMFESAYVEPVSTRGSTKPVYRKRNETVWSALLDFELHTYLVDACQERVDKFVHTRVWKMMLLLCALAGGVLGTIAFGAEHWLIGAVGGAIAGLLALPLIAALLLGAIWLVGVAVELALFFGLLGAAGFALFKIASFVFGWDTN